MLVAFAWGMSRGITPAMHLLSERADNLVIFSRMDAVDKACDAHDTLGAKSANDLPMMELPSGGRVPSVLVAAGAPHESSNWDVGSVLCVQHEINPKPNPCESLALEEPPSLPPQFSRGQPSPM